MLSVSPLRNPKDENTASFTVGTDGFSEANLLDDIDFGDLFMGLDDGDILPDLEMESEMLAEFSSVEDSEVNNVSSSSVKGVAKEEKVSNSSGSEEFASRREESVVTKKLASSLDGDRGRKPASSQAKNSQGKRKVKVDWTPELHRRFVQAVEQLGVDKAVPSRILEIMGIDCLTRHNIASHLQKYRSHRKHLLAREAEAASWSQRRQIYGGYGGPTKREMAPWLAPTIGFPPPTTMQPFRPLHVWGHPTVDQSLVHVWPKPLVHATTSTPPAPWAPPTRPPMPPDPSYWHPHHQRGSKDVWKPNALTQGTPCFPQALTTTRLPAPPVPGIPPHAVYKTDKSIAMPNGQPASQLEFDFHPSNETIDAALGDVLAKPWLPLPLGLKPPSIDSVMVELQRQGVSKIPPSCA